jgi:hypothetical protein
MQIDQGLPENEEDKVRPGEKGFLLVAGWATGVPFTIFNDDDGEADEEGNQLPSSQEEQRGNAT